MNQMVQSVNKQSIGAAVSQALALHQAGRLAEAEQIYRSVLSVDENQFEALHFLGLIEAQRGNNKEASRLISRSLNTVDQCSRQQRAVGAVMPQRRRRGRDPSRGDDAADAAADH